MDQRLSVICYDGQWFWRQHFGQGWEAHWSLNAYSPFAGMFSVLCVITDCR